MFSFRVVNPRVKIGEVTARPAAYVPPAPCRRPYPPSYRRRRPSSRPPTSFPLRRRQSLERRRARSRMRGKGEGVLTRIVPQHPRPLFQVFISLYSRMSDLSVGLMIWIRQNLFYLYGMAQSNNISNNINTYF